MSETGGTVAVLLLFAALLVILDIVRFGPGSGATGCVYRPSTKSNEHDRMSGGGW